MLSFPITIDGFLASAPVLDFIDANEKKHQLEYLSDGTLSGFTKDIVHVMLAPLEYLASRDLIPQVTSAYVHIDDPGTKEGNYTVTMEISVPYEPVTLCYHGVFSPVAEMSAAQEWLALFGILPVQTYLTRNPDKVLVPSAGVVSGSHHYDKQEAHRVAYAVSTLPHAPRIDHKGLAVYDLQTGTGTAHILATPPVFYARFFDYLDGEPQTRSGGRYIRMLYEKAHGVDLTVVVPPAMRSLSLRHTVQNFR